MRSRRWAWLVPGFVAADLVVSTAVWFASPAFVERWDGTCRQGTALVVFFGGENSHTISRVDVAAAALATCPQLEAYLVGGARPLRSTFGSEQMKTMLENAGIAGGRLFTEKASYDSVGNVKAMFELAAARGLQDLVMVSDPLHLIRLARQSRGHAMQGSYRISGLPAWPGHDPLAFWWRPNHEALAWLLWMLPEEVFARIIRFFRS